MQIHFQKCSSSQLMELVEISKTTFVESFEKDNDPDDFNNYIDSSFASSTMVKQLENRNSFFYFVFINDRLAGYFKLNTGDAQTEVKADSSIELERIYLLKEYQGRKIGKQMLEESIRLASEMNKEYIWLGVWEKNTDAIRFYQKHKFTKFDTHPYYIGKDKQTDWLMRYDLT